MALDSQENARLDLKLTLTTGTAHIASVHKIIETPKSESPPFQKTICALFVDIHLRFAMAMVLWANWWPSAARKASPNFCWKPKPPTPARSGGRKKGFPRWVGHVGHLSSETPPRPAANSCWRVPWSLPQQSSRSLLKGTDTTWDIQVWRIQIRISYCGISAGSRLKSCDRLRIDYIS